MDLLDDMRIFVNAVEAMSFTGAATKLGLSKQFVSRRIASLEQSLGARLLLRTTRRLAVTDLGRIYYERARRILEDVEAANLAVSSQGERPRGNLRVSAPMSFGTMFLGSVIPSFLSTYPDVSIELELNDRTVDIIGEGYDAAVRIGALADSSLIARNIAPMRMVTCASPRYLEAHGTPETPEALREHALLPYGHSQRVTWTYQRDGHALDIPVSGRLRVNNGELARDAAVAGLGITLLPVFIVAPALLNGRLVTVLDAFAPPEAAIHVVYPQHRQASLVIRAFADFLAAACGVAGARW
ncbi:LysR family transcriptional regulator [Pandoraea nosoerga]|uniref:LysR family transcriptional regulator n=1 Tax=Pandoraea nosoerga TaxID=2508296 RepID=A0A5E4S201_9BURK|nr:MULTISPECIES: LysR family transcriptional regulator [Pandoraea]MBN4667698.1 LysR family transcriptional regulator [Pandoraea nosoerga]MBN4676650.1 LysR family transcriptional regulator [Pandoraea nosoerga]MBN4683098.1 LysR family transcriptional regulator [Pandoraea nosoerga]MBN4743419.1 LysR family transcriptional regulator [Pandoraea nosoerga]VVD68712.1 LysR family transcriptional regulator [Pandoraea nosoerga]